MYMENFVTLWLPIIFVFVHIGLFFVSGLNKYVPAKLLDSLFVLDLSFVTIFILSHLCDNLYRNVAIVIMLLSAYFGIVLVWLSFKVNVIKPSKVYLLKDIKVVSIKPIGKIATRLKQHDVESKGLCGKIEESGRSFDVIVWDKKAVYLYLQKKTINVTLLKISPNEIYCDALMKLA